MSTLLIKHAGIILLDKILSEHALYCADGRISAVMPDHEAKDLACDETFDARGHYVAPGFIDLHIHGTGNLLADKGKNQLEALCRLLPRYGVTGFLAGILPQKNEEEDIKLIKSLSGTLSEGMSLLGFLFEGHFVSLTGAITNVPADHTIEKVQKMIMAAKPYPAVFCISPEIDGICELLPDMTQNGTLPAFITHTAATVEQTLEAIRRGAVHATHFYDVFPYPGEKDPGVRACGTVEAIMSKPGISVDFILDGEHVDPVAVQMALACKGADKVCLITDANVNAGLPPGRYESLGGYDVIVDHEGGPARIAENGFKPGVLAGSGLTMDRIVQNAVRMLDIDLPLAVRLVSANPAAVLRLSDHKGQIREGYDADIVVMDQDLHVVKTYVSGRCRYDGTGQI